MACERAWPLPDENEMSRGGCPAMGHILLDANLLVIRSDHDALELVRSNAEVLLLIEGRLYTPQQPRLLQDGLRRTAVGRPTAWALARPGHLPLTLKVQVFPAFGAGKVWSLRLCDPQQLVPDLDLLAQMLGLTPTEARVARSLALGRGTAEIALRMGVQKNTIQVHIKRILQKNGLRRQAELVSLLLRSVAMPDALPSPASRASEMFAEHRSAQVSVRGLEGAYLDR